jgi:hypothetical protein
MKKTLRDDVMKAENTAPRAYGYPPPDTVIAVVHIKKDADHHGSTPCGRSLASAAQEESTQQHDRDILWIQRSDKSNGVDVLFTGPAAGFLDYASISAIHRSMSAFGSVQSRAMDS